MESSRVSLSSHAQRVARLRQIFGLFNALLMGRAPYSLPAFASVDAAGGESGLARSLARSRVLHNGGAGTPLREFPLKGLGRGNARGRVAGNGEHRY